MHISLIVNKVMGELRVRVETKQGKDFTEQSGKSLERSLSGTGWTTVSGGDQFPADSNYSYRLLSSRSLF